MVVIIFYTAEFGGKFLQGTLEGPNFPLFNTKGAAKNTQQTLVSIILAKFDNPSPSLNPNGGFIWCRGGGLPPPIYLGPILAQKLFSPKDDINTTYLAVF